MIEIIQTIKWPTTIIILVLILRNPLSELIKKTKNVLYKDLQIDFGEDLQIIESEAENIPSEHLNDTEIVDAHNTNFDLYDIADISPNQSIVEAWRSVECSAKKLIKMYRPDTDFDVETPFRKMQNILYRGNIIDKQSTSVFKKLRQLRNKVVHAEGYELSPDQAKKYVDLALKLRSYLEYMSSKIAKKD